jgi:hypothetical protein
MTGGLIQIPLKEHHFCLCVQVVNRYMFMFDVTIGVNQIYLR